MYRPKPKKLGHIVLLVRDIRASVKFYEDVVGLTVSDWIDDRMVFLRAGEDHHDMALAQLPPNAAERQPGTPGLEHFSYQVESFEVIEKTVEMLKERGITIDRGPGKHGAGENCFMVFKDPDGNNVEFYCDMRQITDDAPYEPSVWDDGIDAFDVWHLERFAVPPPARFKNLKKK